MKYEENGNDIACTIRLRNQEEKSKLFHIQPCSKRERIMAPFARTLYYYFDNVFGRDFSSLTFLNS
jgi:hypothetical protein